MKKRYVKRKRGPAKKAYNNKRRKYKKAVYQSDKLFFRPKLGGAPIPSRYVTKFSSTLVGVTGSGVGTGSYRWIVKGGSVYQPFNFGPGTGFSGLNIFGGSALAQQCTGFTNLCNVNMWAKFRVLASAIDVHLNPGGAIDSMEVTITPTASSTTPTTLVGAYGQRFTVGGEFSSGKDLVLINPVDNKRSMTKKKSLSNYCTTADLIGVPRRAIDYDLSGQYMGTYSSDPAVYPTWIVIANTGDNNTLANPCDVRITMTYYVELFYDATANMV